MTNALPQVAGVIGYPLGHTLSPALQQAAFDLYGLPVTYEVWETPPSQLAGRIEQLRRPEVVGANVTVPYKEAVLPALDNVETEAAFIGAVNTIVNRSGRLYGYNTDVSGFLRALREDLGIEPKGAAAVLFGAGGAARAVAYALVREGVRSLIVVNRHQERAQALLADLAPRAARTDLQTASWDEEGASGPIAKADLVVNATSLGMWHGAAATDAPPGTHHISARAAAYDLVYNPPETPFVKAARDAGARAATGLSMLVYQGVEAFRLWTGLAAPVPAMMEAAREALANMGWNNA
ncbi:MAG: shikimate dehydrogenase [Chloroflexota bacterium]